MGLVQLGLLVAMCADMMRAQSVDQDIQESIVRGPAFFRGRWSVEVPARPGGSSRVRKEEQREGGEEGRGGEGGNGADVDGIGGGSGLGISSCLGGIAAA